MFRYFHLFCRLDPPVHDDEMNLSVDVMHLDPVHPVEPHEESLGVHLDVLVVVWQYSSQELRLGRLRGPGKQAVQVSRL